MMASISGELGAGKTFVLARKLYHARMQGCYCVANFDHIYANKVIQNNPEELLELIRQIAVLKQLGGEIGDIIPTFDHTGIFIAVDEAHLTFGRATENKDMEDIILPFVSLARKQDVHIVYTVQDPATIHKTFRRYTREWIRVRPIIPIFKTIYVPHESRPIMRREKRLLIKWVWEEVHHLNFENPTFNYRRRRIEGGGSVWHETSTLISRRIKKNSDTFIHSLYDSNELSGVNVDPERLEDFKMIKESYFVPSTYHKDNIPTFRPILSRIGLVKPNIVPPRIRVTDWQMPMIGKEARKNPKLKQSIIDVPASKLIKNQSSKIEVKKSDTIKLDRLQRKSKEKRASLSNTPALDGNI